MTGKASRLNPILSLNCLASITLNWVPSAQNIFEQPLPVSHNPLLSRWRRYFQASPPREGSIWRSRCPDKRTRKRLRPVSLNQLKLLDSQERETVSKTTAAKMCLKRINKIVFMLDDEIPKCYEEAAHNYLELEIPYEIFLRCRVLLLQLPRSCTK